MAWRWLVVLCLLSSSFGALAKAVTDKDNRLFVAHFKKYYQIEVTPAQDASPSMVIEELYQLESYEIELLLRGESSVPSNSLVHLTCGAAPCGGCSKGPC